MKRALELAEMGAIHASPNPAVGAVLVKEGKIIGEGYHRGPGSLHAEIDAIDNSSESLVGATLYSTMEPCVTMYKGKLQKPCTDRIISEKISQVIISITDPNEYVNGKGIKKLQDAGIHVRTGILTGQTKILNEIYIKNMEKSLPFVHLKIAQTLDGKIATKSKDSKWITDHDARKDVHKLRSLYDSILIGVGTVEIDNPILTVRTENERSINRIVLDSRLSTPVTSLLLDDQNNNKTFIITGNKIDPKREKIFQEKDITIIKLALNQNDQISLKPLLEKLFSMGIKSILVEGGSKIFTSFIKEKLFDKISVYTAPIICGSGTNSVNDIGTEMMGDSVSLKCINLKTINNQFVLTGYREEICLQA